MFLTLTVFVFTNCVWLPVRR